MQIDENEGLENDVDLLNDTNDVLDAGQTEAPKRRGRPPKVVPPEDSTRKTPLPPFHKYSNDLPTGQQPEDLFKWWNAQDAEIKSRLICYVYRHWPVIQIPRKQKNDRITFSTQIDKIQGETPPVNVDEVMRRYGSGDYQLLLNDNLILRTTIARITIKIRNSDHPPVIEDLTSLVTTDPANKSFIALLQTKGIAVPGVTTSFVGQSREDSEEEEMKASAIESLSETNVKLVERIADMADKTAARPQQIQPPPPPNIEAQAVVKSMDMIHEAGKTAMGMVKDAQAQIVGASSKGSDPIQMLTTVMGIVKEAIPKPDNTLINTVTQLQTEIRQMQSAHFEQIIGLVREKNEVTAAQTAAASVAATPKTFIETLREKAEEKRLMKELYAEEDEDKPKRRRHVQDDEDDDETDKPEKGVMGFLNNSLPTILTAGATMLTMGANIWYNLRAGQGAPVVAPPAMPIGDATQQTSAAPNVVQMPSPSQIGTGQTPAQIAAGHGYQPNPSDPNYQAHMFLAQIENGFLAHFRSPDCDGFTFAEFLISGLTGGSPTQEGQKAYDQIKEAGRDPFIETLKTYPPIWDKVQTTQMKLVRFIDDMLSYDEPEDSNNSSNAGNSQRPKKVAVAPAATPRPAHVPTITDGPPAV